MLVIVGRLQNIQRWRIGCEIRRYLHEKLKSELKQWKRLLNTGIHKKGGFLFGDSVATGISYSQDTAKSNVNKRQRIAIL